MLRRDFIRKVITISIASLLIFISRPFGRGGGSDSKTEASTVPKGPIPHRKGPPVKWQEFDFLKPHQKAIKGTDT